MRPKLFAPLSAEEYERYRTGIHRRCRPDGAAIRRGDAPVQPKCQLCFKKISWGEAYRATSTAARARGIAVHASCFDLHPRIEPPAPPTSEQILEKLRREVKKLKYRAQHLECLLERYEAFMAGGKPAPS